jgi:hypothetical protein
MANSVLVIAEPGAGKSTAGRTLDPKETFWINVANKPLPFKGWKKKYKSITKENPTEGNMSKAHRPAAILKVLQIINDDMPHIKTVVVDDWQYMSAFEFFDRADEKGFEKFTEIGQGLARVAKKPAELRDDLTIFFLTHAEETQDAKGRRKQKAKTIGKMVDEKLTLEGLFAIVLYGKVKKNKDGGMDYVFETQNDGSNTCKSPMGMFDTADIPNDLQAVKEAIIKYEQ